MASGTALTKVVASVWNNWQEVFFRELYNGLQKLNHPALPKAFFFFQKVLHLLEPLTEQNASLGAKTTRKVAALDGLCVATQGSRVRPQLGPGWDPGVLHGALFCRKGGDKKRERRMVMRSAQRVRI